MTHRPKPKVDDATGEYLPNGASAKVGLNKSILDAGWYQFRQYCTYKAESAGRAVLFVTPNYTSQMCSGCGQIRKKELSERWHSCVCGTELDRDHNAAINILGYGNDSSKNGPFDITRACPHSRYRTERCKKWYALIGTQSSMFAVRWRDIAPNGPLGVITSQLCQMAHF